MEERSKEAQLYKEIVDLANQNNSSVYLTLNRPVIQGKSLMAVFRENGDVISAAQQLIAILKRERKELKLIMGFDEVGRGAIAGPIALGCFVIEENAGQALLDLGIKDSKKLSENQRIRVYSLLPTRLRKCHFYYDYKVEYRSAVHVDELSLNEAYDECVLSCIRYYHSLYGDQIKTVYFDRGLKPKQYRYIPYPIIEAEKNGEDLYPVVAAASVVAKVERDQLMVNLGKDHPEYGFHSNKGYGTIEHYRALKQYGPIFGEHRLTFLTKVLDLNEKSKKDYYMQEGFVWD